MRFPIAYYLMLLYVTVMFKPLIPIADDVLSHMFSEAIHIATVHAVYGSNHLEKELSDTASDTTGKHQGSVSTEDQVPVHVSTQTCMYDFYLNGTSTDYVSLKPYKINPGFIVKNFPPPKFS